MAKISITSVKRDTLMSRFVKMEAEQTAGVEKELCKIYHIEMVGCYYLTAIKV